MFSFRRTMLLVKESEISLADKLKQIEEATLSAEEMSERVSRMMADEEAAQVTYDEEMRRLRNIHFKTTRQLHKITLEEKNMNAEIQVSSNIPQFVQTLLYW